MKDKPSKILVVDDEPDILDFISYNLEKEGYSVTTANDGTKAIELARLINPDLIMLDIMMPGSDGVEACNRLRNMPEFKETLIVLLTARSEDYSEIAGFDAGADDYITKPIRPRVLIARIKALLKRRLPGDNNTEIITIGNLVINTEQRIVEKEGVKISLPKKEFELLSLMASKPGKIFSRDEIYSRIWGDDVLVGERTLDVHIRKLREMIGNEYIRTSKGIGYGMDL